MIILSLEDRLHSISAGQNTDEVITGKAMNEVLHELVRETGLDDQERELPRQLLAAILFVVSHVVSKNKRVDVLALAYYADAPLDLSSKGIGNPDLTPDETYHNLMEVCNYVSLKHDLTDIVVKDDNEKLVLLLTTYLMTLVQSVQKYGHNTLSIYLWLYVMDHETRRLHDKVRSIAGRTVLARLADLNHALTTRWFSY